VFTATNSSGSAISSWSGCVQDPVDKNRCVIDSLGEADVTVTATFGQNGLTLTKAGTGKGVVKNGDAVLCGLECPTAKIPGTGQSVMLTAVAEEGKSKFVTWGGDAASCGASPLCTLKLDKVVNATVQFDSIASNLILTEVSPKGGTTKITYKLPSETVSQEVLCTGTVCPGLPSPLPPNTVVTLDMQPSKDTGSARLGPYKWSESCASRTYRQPCVLTIGSTPVKVGVEFREQWRVSVSRADVNGSISVSSEDKYEGTTSCNDGTPDRPGTTVNESGCPVGVVLDHWVFKNKKINIVADGDKGYTFSKWESTDCSGATYGTCALSNRAATVKAAFKEFRYRLVVNKCDASSVGVLVGSVPGAGLYCGTAELKLEVNSDAPIICDARCTQMRRDGLRGGVDSWNIKKSLLQGSRFVSSPTCAAKRVVTIPNVSSVTTHYKCVAVPYGDNGGHNIYVTDDSGADAYSRITELNMTYHPRADYDVDPFAAAVQYGTSTAPAPVTDTFIFAAAPDVPVAQVAEEPESLQQASMLASVMTAVDAFREAVTEYFVRMFAPAKSVAQVVQHNTTRLLAAVGIGSADLTPYDLLVLPRGVGVGMPITAGGAVGNIGSLAFAGQATHTLVIEQQGTGGGWSKRFESMKTSSSLAAQQFAFVQWDSWAPTTAGEYRARFCVTAPSGTEVSTTNNCSFYRRFKVTETFDPPPPPSYKVALTNTLGGSLSITKEFTGASYACSIDKDYCDYRVRAGQGVVVVATPAANRRFVRWEGISAAQCSTTAGANKCRLTVDSYKHLKPVFEPTEPLTLCGDADRSGKVTSTDASLVSQHAVGTPVNINLKNADANGDNKINTTDAGIILKAAVGSAKLEVVNGVCKATIL
jgi:hypothetical protein